MKIVINACFGGFSLSHEGVLAYAAKKGLTLYPESEGKFRTLSDPTYWLLPKEQRTPKLAPDEWAAATAEQRKSSNEAWSRETLYPRDIPRDDPDLVATVEALGDAANGRCANLKVVEIPDGVQWHIEEYDGNEHIAEVHRTWS